MCRSNRARLSAFVIVASLAMLATAGIAFASSAVKGASYSGVVSLACPVPTAPILVRAVPAA